MSLRNAIQSRMGSPNMGPQNMGSPIDGFTKHGLPNVMLIGETKKYKKRNTYLKNNFYFILSKRVLMISVFSI